MPARELQTVVFPFSNKGVMLKNEPSTLQPGQYSELTNLVSTQENEINIRNGTQRLSNTLTFGGATLIHTITKMRVSSATDVRYFGESLNIWRVPGPLPPSGASMGITTTSTKVAQNTSAATTFPTQRFTGVTFNAGATGTPYEYFACGAKMLKDNGSTNITDGSGDGTLLAKWGILPPSAAAVAELDKLTLLPETAGVAVTDVIVNGTAGSATGRISTTISSVTSSPSGGGAGFYTVQPASMTGITVGSELKINSLFLMVVTSTTTTTFSGYFSTAPVAAQVVTGSEINQTLNISTDPITAGSGLFEFPTAVAGAEFDGLAPSYETNDVVHVAIGVAEPGSIADIRLRVMVGASYSATGADYYEKSISISPAQTTTSLSQTATQTLNTNVPQGQTGIIGDFLPVDPLSQDIKSVDISPISPNQSTSVPVYTENDILKSDFVAVGNAGTSNFTWKNVVGFQVVAKASVPSSPPKVWVSSLYIAGGFGPDAFSRSATIPLQPYDYRYTYRNIATGSESNPSVPMIVNDYVTPGRQRVVLTLCGTRDPQIDTSASAFSIAVYRRGGSFSDGLYRLVGYATNPGAPVISSGVNTNSVLFKDSQADINLIYANILEFDNDPPVTSTLPNLVRLLFGSYGSSTTGAAGRFSTLSLGVIGSLPSATLSTFLFPGSILTFARGTPKEEQCVVLSVAGGNFTTVFFQYDHSDFSTLSTICAECSSVVNQPCPLAVSAFDSIFLAGDPNNPHVVYKSKTGRPEAFPVVDLATGIAGSQIVGSPSNPIKNLCEYGGGLLFLNLSNIYYMRVAYGIMEVPIETPATRGLVSTKAWCKADNEIWYLSYDGIYSWSGGQSMKRSEAIDPLFKGVQVGPYPPIDMRQNLAFEGTEVVTMEYNHNEVFMVYLAQDGNYYRLRYSTIYDRWSIDYFEDPISGAGIHTPITAMYCEQDVGNLLIAKYVSTAPPALAYMYLDNIGESDGWVNNHGDGIGIPYMAKTAAYVMGAPSLNKQYMDWIMEFDNDLASATAATKVDFYYDFSDTANVSDSTSVAPPVTALGRRRYGISLQSGYGKEAYAMAVRLSGRGVGSSATELSTNPMTFYSMTFNYYPLEQIQVGRATDWDDLGYPWDKRIYTLTVTYDIPVGQSVTLNLDTITGIAGAQQENTAVQTFTLTAPSTGTSGAPTRLMANFALDDVMIVKQVRLRPTVITTPFKYFSYNFGEFEKLPPDWVRFTPWSTYGSEYDKYAQQIDLNVDTGGVNATVTLQADDATVAGPFTVNTTSENRQVNLTMPPQVIGKQFRLISTPGGGGKFQLYDHKIIFEPADRGAVHANFDWDYLDWPYEKHFKEVTIEYDTANTPEGSTPNPTTVKMDTMTGVKGGTITIGAYSFLLDQTGRALQTFPFPEGVYATQVRLYPQSNDTVFKEWKYKFMADNMPPNIIEFTDWTDLGWPCEKILRSLELEINTGGVDATVSLQGDGVTLYTFTVNTTINDRRRIVTLPSNLIVKNERLLFSPGVNGRAQYFKHSYEFIKEPCTVTHWDSYETSFGYDGWSFIKQMWVQYVTPGTLTVSIYSDGGTLFYQKVLPAHAQRDVERFYLPAYQFTGGNPVLNKSKRHRIVVDSTQPMKFYPDSSRVEWQPIGMAQRQGYQQLPWSEITAIDTGFGTGMQ